MRMNMSKARENPVWKVFHTEHRQHFKTNLVTNASVTVLVRTAKHSIMLLFSSAVTFIKMYLSNVKFDKMKGREENDSVTYTLCLFQLLTDNTAIP